MPEKTIPTASLSDFVELNDGQHWYKPPDCGSLVSSPTIPPTAQPDLIIFCAWAFAAPKHILKYIIKYQATYPRAQILLLQNNLANMIWTPDRVQMDRLKPTVTAMEAFLETNTFSGAGGPGRKSPVILVHAFSNGGAHSLVQLAQAYRDGRASTSPSSPQARLPAELPVSAIILDSCPGRADFQIGVKLALMPVPKTAILLRLLFTPIAYATIASILSIHMLGISENMPSKLWRCLNNVHGPFLIKVGKTNASCPSVSGGNAAEAVPRTYIYSTRDDMIPWQGVVEHAEEARQALRNALDDSRNGRTDVIDLVRLEGFMGSPHVNHVSVDPTRYWRIVRETVGKAVGL
ncbi:hypothetical protein PV04_08799 [Phialophora macrospora]|uniref:Indole-diterpene biosynthesis protein PaxU n=1 Tax=Phialophora macrospora TaxID=1851006 RepID=A0A0D2DNG4_9EURO|nr:hypothetical protein PV04_08799 [Phialophora macrospora]